MRNGLVPCFPPEAFPKPCIYCQLDASPSGFPVFDADAAEGMGAAGMTDGDEATEPEDNDPMAELSGMPQPRKLLLFPSCL